MKKFIVVVLAMVAFATYMIHRANNKPIKDGTESALRVSTDTHMVEVVTKSGGTVSQTTQAVEIQNQTNPAISPETEKALAQFGLSAKSVISMSVTAKEKQAVILPDGK